MILICIFVVTYEFLSGLMTFLSMKKIKNNEKKNYILTNVTPKASIMRGQSKSTFVEVDKKKSH